MEYEIEIKVGQRVYLENADGQKCKATVINVNYYREPSMTVALNVAGVPDVVFASLENIRILEDE